MDDTVAAGRVTPQRQAVLAALRASHDHPTAHEVYQRVQTSSPGIGVATVYRALDRLVESGQARALSLGETAARYDANVDAHDHLVCDGCGAAVDVARTVADDALTQAAAGTGFAVHGYDLQLRGLCARCQLAPTTDV